MVGCDHEDDPLVLIDFIEETPGADSITPRFGLEAPEFFDVRSKMRVLAKLRIDELPKLVSNFALARPCDATQVFLKLFSFKYSVLIQQSVLFEPGRHENLS